MLGTCGSCLLLTGFNSLPTLIIFEPSAPLQGPFCAISGATATGVGGSTAGGASVVCCPDGAPEIVPTSSLGFAGASVASCAGGSGGSTGGSLSSGTGTVDPLAPSNNGRL